MRLLIGIMDFYMRIQYLISFWLMLCMSPAKAGVQMHIYDEISAIRPSPSPF